MDRRDALDSVLYRIGQQMGKKDLKEFQKIKETLPVPVTLDQKLLLLVKHYSVIKSKK